MSQTLALVVPSLHQGGGVPSVARFILETAINSGRWDVRPISLCMSSRDEESSSLLRPFSLLRGPLVGERTWMEMPVPHVGAHAGEIEFQRYRPRQVLSRLVEECDVVQVVCGSPAWANTVVGLGKPVALQVATLARVERRARDGNGRGAAAAWRRTMTRFTDRMDDRALRHVDAIQVENPWMLDHVRQVTQERQGVDVRYAPPGVDTAVFKPAMERNCDHGYVLCVGRLSDPRKNIGLLLEAYARLPAALRQRHALVLAGADAPPPAFWERASELGLKERVRFIHRPEREALVALYQAASLFALPSDEEGLGVVVLEAMACGVPAVCTRSGGPDGIICDGVDGRLVALDDAAGMADAMTDILQRPSVNAEMGMAARKTIESRYAIECAGAQFLDVWDLLLARKLQRHDM